MKEFKLPPDILSEIAFHVVGNMEPRLHMIIRDVIDSVTLEAREELQKMVAAQAGAHCDSADKLKALQERLLAWSISLRKCPALVRLQSKSQASRTWSASPQRRKP